MSVFDDFVKDCEDRTPSDLRDAARNMRLMFPNNPQADVLCKHWEHTADIKERNIRNALMRAANAIKPGL